MSQQARCAARPGGVRLYAVLVMALLAGLVAMHGLGPGLSAVSSSSAVPGSQHSVTAAAQAHSAPAVCQGCAHAGHDTGGAGGHAEHADSTCSAAGTGGAPALPALGPAAVAGCPTADALAVAPTATPGERSPPSLSELQLLRI